MGKRTAQRLYVCLQVEGYVGGYSTVQRYVKSWKALRSAALAIKQAFVPLLFPAGETCQFDWSHERVVIAGVEQVVKVAHFRLSYSRQMFVAAYPRETQERVLDAHNQAFAFFGGVPKRMPCTTGIIVSEGWWFCDWNRWPTSNRNGWLVWNTYPPNTYLNINHLWTDDG